MRRITVVASVTGEERDASAAERADSDRCRSWTVGRGDLDVGGVGEKFVEA